MSAQLTVLDLFSGIGGFSLGLERTGGFKTVAFCEIDPFCWKVIGRHWPAARVYTNITLAKLGDENVDVITAGFPCQDLSRAGGRAGLSGERSGLWRYVVDTVRVVRPRYVLLENVAEILSDDLGTVLGDLASIGYDAEWHCIPASAVGAPHLRDRWWGIAYPHADENRREPVIGLWPKDNSHQPDEGRVFAGFPWWDAQPKVERVVDGLPTELDKRRVAALGNSLVPQIPELIGHAILAAEAA